MRRFLVLFSAWKFTCTSSFPCSSAFLLVCCYFFKFSFVILFSQDFEFLQVPEVTFTQWLTFMIAALIIPESLVIIFAYQMFEHHTITPLFVITTAILYTLIEWITWLLLYQESGRCVRRHRQSGQCLLQAFSKMTKIDLPFLLIV